MNEAPSNRLARHPNADLFNHGPVRITSSTCDSGGDYEVLKFTADEESDIFHAAGGWMLEHPYAYVVAVSWSHEHPQPEGVLEGDEGYDLTLVVGHAGPPEDRSEDQARGERSEAGGERTQVRAEEPAQSVDYHAQCGSKVRIRPDDAKGPFAYVFDDQGHDVRVASCELAAGHIEQCEMFVDTPMKPGSPAYWLTWPRRQPGSPLNSDYTWLTSDENCQAESSNGWHCGRPGGHRGGHSYTAG